MMLSAVSMNNASFSWRGSSIESEGERKDDRMIERGGGQEDGKRKKNEKRDEEGDREEGDKGQTNVVPVWTLKNTTLIIPQVITMHTK